MDKLVIRELYAYIAENEEGEGVIAWMTPEGNWKPCVGADMQRINSLKDEVKQISKKINKKIYLKKFSTVEILEVIDPD